MNNSVQVALVKHFLLKWVVKIDEFITIYSMSYIDYRNLSTIDATYFTATPRPPHLLSYRRMI